MTNTTNRLATINTKDIHTPTRSITQWLYSLPYLHHPLHSSWQALIVLEGLDQGMELLLAAGDSTPTGDKGIIDWFRDPDMFGDEDLTRSFCQEIIDYAAIHNNFSLDRPAGETLRSLNWQIDEQETGGGLWYQIRRNRFLGELHLLRQLHWYSTPITQTQCSRTVC